MRRTTRRRLVRGVLYAVLVAAVALLVAVADWEQLRANFLDVGIARSMFPQVVTVAARNTLLYTVLSFLMGLGLGLVLAMMRLSPVGPYRWLATTYIEVFRGLPVLVTLFLFGFGVPIAFGTDWPPLLAGVLALGLVAAAYMAETIRSGIQAVPQGQREAARSLGMSRLWTMASIVLPQAFRIIVPPLTNEFVLLLKDTSLFFVLGLTLGERELTKYGSDVLLQRSNSTPLLVVGLVYLAVTVPLTQLVAWLERRRSSPA